VVAAARGGTGLDVRRSATLGTDLVYAARRTEGAGGADGAGRVPPGILRLAVPYSQVQDRLARDTDGLLLILATTLAGTGLLALWLTRRMAGTIKAFSATAKAIGDGDFESRIRVWPGSEFQPLAETVNAMAKKIRRQLKTIEDQANEHAAVFEGMAEGVAVIGPDGKILAHNHALAGMFPTSLGLVGRHPLETGMDLAIQEAVTAELLGPAENAGEGGEGAGDGTPEPLSMRLPGGRHVEVALVPFLDHKSRPRLILVFHDVSAERRAADILRSFVIDASHRLRTPLTSIKGYAETLLDNPPQDPEAGRSLMSIILKNADVMGKVVTDLLSRASTQCEDRRPERPGRPERKGGA
jgi:two-component system phosphate regulon sensor histidine kinase PhoR